ncbi:MAG: NAD-dependent deacylase [Myxococcales bacterium]|nr:NAD-dependent deacylase [Myxococcales bacterium]
MSQCATQGDSQPRIAVDDRTHVLALTGAGVSAESGIATFRGAKGLWEGHRIEEVASPEGFAADPQLVWRFYSARREKAALAQPNPGHRALAALEERLGDRFLLASQNVDDLHGRAGSTRLVELHGNLFRTRCSECDREPFRDEKSYAAGPLPQCDLCLKQGRRALFRPHIVWFGEMLDPEDLRRVDEFLARPAERLIFLAAGTSGVVWPAAGLVDLARRRGAQTWLVNAEPAENSSRFHHFILGKSGEVLPGLLGVE